MSERPLRLMIYDRTCKGRGLLPGLSHSWIAGALLYTGLRRLDHTRGVGSWEEGLAFLADVALERPIGEIQFWGHGKWGQAFVGRDVLDERSLGRHSPEGALLRRIAARMTPSSLFWFRTCETFGAERGQRFARDFTDLLGCDGAGHTYIIGPWQSGLHRLRPGEQPRWSADEGLAEGTRAAPAKAEWSTPSAPNTITCLHGAVPEGF